VPSACGVRKSTSWVVAADELGSLRPPFLFLTQRGCVLRSADRANTDHALRLFAPVKPVASRGPGPMQYLAQPLAHRPCAVGRAVGPHCKYSRPAAPAKAVTVDQKDRLAAARSARVRTALALALFPSAASAVWFARQMPSLPATTIEGPPTVAMLLCSIASSYRSSETI